MKHKKMFILFSIILIGIFSYFILYHGYFKKDNHYPILNLKHPEMIILKNGEDYQEPGYTANDKKDGDITKKVKIKGTVNVNKRGLYKLEYEVTNSIQNTTKTYRYIKVEKEENLTYKSSYDKIDNQQKGWWSGNRKDHTIPEGGERAADLKKYDAYFTGPNKKVLYLTFDEGSNDTYLKEIVEVLDKYNIKATFFLCRRYILDNKTLVNKMVKKGHSIGNHTASHKQMPTLANAQNFNEYLKEIKRTEEAFYQVTKKQMDYVYREPSGEWSFRSLQIMKDLGYKTYFWSAAYMDYGENLSKAKALSEMLKLYHNGAIYLIHPKNKGNYEALEEFIKIMTSKGYQFDLVKNIK